MNHSKIKNVLRLKMMIVPGLIPAPQAREKAMERHGDEVETI